MTLSSSAVIRRFEERDCDQLLALFEQVAAEGRWIGTETGFDRDAYASRWRNNVCDPDSCDFVVEVGERIAGYAGVYPHEDGPMIGMLVGKEFRRSGLGAALLQTAIDWARAKNLPEINLLVFPHNDAAIALYRTSGFEERARYHADVTRKSGEVWDTILMKKQL